MDLVRRINTFMNDSELELRMEIVTILDALRDICQEPDAKATTAALLYVIADIASSLAGLISENMTITACEVAG